MNLKELLKYNRFTIGLRCFHLITMYLFQSHFLTTLHHQRSKVYYLKKLLNDL